MLSRLAAILLIMTGLVFVAGQWSDFRFRIPFDEAVRAELSGPSTPQSLSLKINEALDRDDVEDAQMYIELANYQGFALPPATLARMDGALSLGSVIMRNTLQFGSGFLTGDGDGFAGMAGAVTADFTVVGDVRDISVEGAKLVAGQEANRVILGLSVLGLTATAATVASGGGAAIGKAAVSLLKVAKRAGKLTAEFTAVLARAIDRTIDFPALRRTLAKIDLTDFKATEGALSAYAATVKQGEIVPILARLGDIQSAVGPAQTIRMLKFVKTAENLDDVAGMTKQFGRKSRAIMEFTGKTSIRAFKVTYKAGEYALRNAGAWVAWIAGLVALMLVGRFRLWPIGRRRL